MERESKESRGLEAHCRGGQGPPRAVAPSGGGLCHRTHTVLCEQNKVIRYNLFIHENMFTFSQNLCSLTSVNKSCGIYNIL